MKKINSKDIQIVLCCDVFLVELVGVGVNKSVREAEEKYNKNYVEIMLNLEVIWSVTLPVCVCV